MLFLAETSLEADEDDKMLTLENYQQESIKVGNGKGLTTYFDPVVAKVLTCITSEKYQIIKLKHMDIDVINTYRSQTGRPIQFLESLKSVLELDRNTILTGDFNLCFNENRGNKVIDYLLAIGFHQLVQEPTHTKGRLIDHTYWLNKTGKYNAELERYSPYYSDHDGLCITIVERCT